MLLGGLQKTTLIDYPGKVACLVFTIGCNFKCGYCHNPELHIKTQTSISVEEIFSFLKRRKQKLEGVVITGGEPTIQPDLVNFIRSIKELGYLVKLDTQGSFPHVIDTLINNKLIDYIAMDIKAPLHKYKKVSKSLIDENFIKQSISLIMNSEIDYEFRTTLVKEQLDLEDIKNIGKLIMGANRFYLQKFISTKVLDKDFLNYHTFSDNEIIILKQIMEGYVTFCGIR